MTQQLEIQAALLKCYALYRQPSKTNNSAQIIQLILTADCRSFDVPYVSGTFIDKYPGLRSFLSFINRRLEAIYKPYTWQSDIECNIHVTIATPLKVLNNLLVIISLPVWNEHSCKSSNSCNAALHSSLHWNSSCWNKFFQELSIIHL